MILYVNKDDSGNLLVVKDRKARYQCIYRKNRLHEERFSCNYRYEDKHVKIVKDTPIYFRLLELCRIEYPKKKFNLY